MKQTFVRWTGRQQFLLSLALAGVLLGGCAGVDSRGEVPTVASVDLNRYVGTWYEIARLPMWFQRHCVDSRAVYTLRPDGAIGVHNECVTDAGGRDEIEGVATVGAEEALRTSNGHFHPGSNCRPVIRAGVIK